MNADPTYERPRYAAAITEDLLIGHRRLRQAFLGTPLRYVARDAPLVRLDDREPAVLLIRNGFAFRSSSLADGRRVILQIVVPAILPDWTTSCSPARSRRSRPYAGSATTI